MKGAGPLDVLSMYLVLRPLSSTYINFDRQLLDPSIDPTDPALFHC